MVITRYGNKRIGIIGAGVAGLHLALRLQQMNVDCTIITEHAPDEVAESRLSNTVVHWPATLGRERILRVSHWSEEQFGFSRIHHIVQTKRPIEIHGRTSAPARAVDYRVYLPRLMEDFVDRGGRLEVRSLDAQDIGRVADRFDLVVVATRHHGFANLFARDAAKSPYQQPQRAWMAGLFTGFSADAARGATLSISPGHGEAIQMPMLSRNGMTTALLISSSQPEQPMLPAELSSSADQAGLPAALLRKLEQHHPAIYEQIDTARFDLQDPRDLTRVAITPVVRDPVAHLGDGKCAIAVGDTHVTFDPVLAQGANIGSYSAFVLACAIQKTGAFDQTFCQAIERARSARVLGAARWTNAFLQPSDEARAELLKAMSKDEFLADEYPRELQSARATMGTRPLAGDHSRLDPRASAQFGAEPCRSMTAHRAEGMFRMIPATLEGGRIALPSFSLHVTASKLAHILMMCAARLKQRLYVVDAQRSCLARYRTDSFRRRPRNTPSALVPVIGHAKVACVQT